MSFCNGHEYKGMFLSNSRGEWSKPAVQRSRAARSMTSPSSTLTGEGWYSESSQSSGRVSPMTLIEDAKDVYFERKEKQEGPSFRVAAELGKADFPPRLLLNIHIDGVPPSPIHLLVHCEIPCLMKHHPRSPDDLLVT